MVIGPVFISKGTDRFALGNTLRRVCMPMLASNYTVNINADYLQYNLIV